MKILIYLAFIILNTFALGNPSRSNTAPLDLTSHPFYNTLHSRDCSIPEGTQVVHYPSYHASSFEGVFEDLATRSSFSFLQFLKKHPQAVIFPESIWFENTLSERMSEVNEYIAYLNFDISTIDSIKNVKNKNSYDQLTEEEKRFLYATGGISPFFLEMPHQIHAVTLFSNEDELSTSYWTPYGIKKRTLAEITLERFIINIEKYLELIDLAKQIKNNSLTEDQIQEEFSSIYAEIKNLEKQEVNFLLQFRDSLLFEAVEKRMSESDNQNKLAVIFYGIAHDFSDEFRQMNFYTLPFSCTIGEPPIDWYVSLLLTTSQSHPNDEVKQQILYNELVRLWNSSSQEDKTILRQTLFQELSNQGLFSLFRNSWLKDLEQMEFETALYVFRNDNLKREIIFHSLLSISEFEIQVLETQLAGSLEQLKFQGAIPFIKARFGLKDSNASQDEGTQTMPSTSP